MRLIRKFRLEAVLVALFVGVGTEIWAADSATERKPIEVAVVKRTAPVDFGKDVLPSLRSSCLACHSKSNSKGDLVLESVESILKGGESGPAVVPKQPGKSLLMQLASHRSKPFMPPRDNKANAPNLTPEQLGLLELWISQGAKAGAGGQAEVKLGELPVALKSVYAVTLNADGSRAAAARGSRIGWFDLVSGREAGTLVDPALGTTAHRDFVQALALSPDGQTLASGSFREVKIWRREPESDLVSGRKLSAAGLTALRLDPEGNRIAWADKNGAVGVSDARSRKSLRKLRAVGAAASALGWSSSGELVVFVDESGTLTVWDANSGRIRMSRPVEGQNGIKLSQLNSTGSDLMLLSRSGRLEHLNVSTDTIALKGAWQVDAAKVVALAAPEGGSTEAIVAMDDGALKRAKAGAAELQNLWKTPSKPKRLARSSVGNYIAVLGEDHVLRIGQVGTEKPARELKFDPSEGFLFEEADRRSAFFASDVDYFKAGLTKASKEFDEEGARKKRAQEALVGLGKKAEETLKNLETSQKNARDAQAIFDAGTLRLREATNLFTNFLGTAKLLVGARIPETDLKSFVERISKESAAEFKQVEEKWTAASNALSKAEAEHKKVLGDQSRGVEEVELATQSEAKSKEVVDQAKAQVASAEIRKGAAEKLKQDREASWTKTSLLIEHLEFQRDGRVLRAMGKDGSVYRWRVEDGRAFTSETVEPSRSHRSESSNSGVGRELMPGVSATDLSHPRVMAWVSGPGTVSLRREDVQWRLERTLQGVMSSGSKKGVMPSRISDRVNALRFSPDGKLLVAGAGEPSRGGELWVWRLPRYEAEGPVTKLHSDTILGLDFSQDGKQLLTSGSDRFVRMVSTTTWEVVKSFEGHTHHVLGVSWKPGDRMLASAGADNMVKVWDAISGERRKNVEGFGKEVTALSFVPWSSQIVAAAGDGQVLLLKETGETVRALGRRYDYMYSLGISGDGRWAGGGGEEGALRIWDLSTGKEIWELK